MWKFILNRFGYKKPSEVDDFDGVLYDKILLMLDRSKSNTHLVITKKLIHQYEQRVQEKGFPLEMVKRCNTLISMWNNCYITHCRGQYGTEAPN